jgi:RNA binding exosome subunit
MKELHMEGKIGGLTCITFCHSTEDEQIIERALRVLGENAELEWKSVETHFGNRMKVATLRLGGADDLKRMISKMPVDEREALISSLPERVDDESILHIRLDKQSLVGGEIRLASSYSRDERKERDTVDISVRVVTYPKGRENAVKFIASIMQQG